MVAEERRLRVDNAALGPFQAEFAQRSLTNNYRRPVIGYAADLERTGRREVAAFFRSHYGPASLTVAVVGDVRAGEVRRLAEKYFGGWSSGAEGGAACAGGVGSEALARPPPGARELAMRSRAGPAVLRAWYRPCARSPDAAALDAVGDVLASTRSSRLYRSLVEGGAALSVSSFSTFPAEKHSCQMVAFGVPAPGLTAESLDEAIQGEVAALAGEGPTEGELRRYTKVCVCVCVCARHLKHHRQNLPCCLGLFVSCCACACPPCPRAHVPPQAARLGVLSVLQANSSLAGALASYQALTGSWRGVNEDLAAIEALTPGGVRDVAARYLTPDNSFVGFVLPP